MIVPPFPSGPLPGRPGGARAEVPGPPWIPATKGGAEGAVAGLAGFISALQPGNNLSLRLEVAGWLLLIPACSAFLGMNFTPKGEIKR